MNPVWKYKEKEGNRTITIYYDEFAESPREWDNLGHMICFHSRYDLGDKHYWDNPDDAWEELLENNKEEDIIDIGLRLYDHSGITMSTTGSGYPYNDWWDSMEVGFIYTTRKEILEWFNRKHLTQKLRDKARKVLEQEVDVYDDYISGTIFFFNEESHKTCDCCKQEIVEFLDGCGGFYGWKADEDIFEHLEYDMNKWEQVDIR